MSAPAAAAQPKGPESGTDTGSVGATSTHGPAGSGSDTVAEHDDGWMLLDSLRRRLDDQVAQTRRTHDQVSQLAESIAALVATQRRRSRWLNLNSFVAYLIFTMLLGAGFLFVYHSRANELLESRQTAVSERDAAVRRADEGATKASARDKAEQKAWDAYQLLEQGKRAEATQLAALRDLPLSRTERAVVGERAHQSQVAEVDAVLKAAVAAFKAGRFADVIVPLEAALKAEPPPARAAQMHYYLGVAYAKGDAKPAELEKSASHLQAAVNADVDQEDARFHLASVLDRTGAYPKARLEYDKFATAHPQSQLAAFAMRRSATLARMPAAPPQPAPGAVVVPPRPVTPGASGAVPVPAPQQLQRPATPAATPPTVQPAPTKAPAPAPTQPMSAPPPAVDGPEGSLWVPPRNDEPQVAIAWSVDGIVRYDAPKQVPEPTKPANPAPDPKPTDPPKPSPEPKPTPEPKKPAPEPKPEPTKPAEPTKPTPDPTKPSPKPFDPGKPTTPTKPRDGVTEGRPKPPVAPREGVTDRPQQPALPIVPRDGVADEPTPPTPNQPHPTVAAPVMAAPSPPTPPRVHAHVIDATDERMPPTQTESDPTTTAGAPGILSSASVAP